MNRPWKIWLAFGLCLVVAAAAMGLVSLTAVRLDTAERDSRQRAALEENARLALWRMDSAVATLIARESARPYFVYSAFYPSERAYTRMYSEIGRGEVLFPSPLLRENSLYVRLHFQIDPEGRFTSPQAPVGNMLDLAEAKYASARQIGLARQRLEKLETAMGRRTLLASLPSIDDPPTFATRAETAEAPAGTRTQPPEQQVAMADSQDRPPVANPPRHQTMQQMALNTEEWHARQRRYQESANIMRNVAIGKIQDERQDTPQAQREIPPEQPTPETSSAAVAEGALKALWIGDLLILARRVAVNGGEYAQGCLLDWDGIRGWLLDEVADLLPGAGLVPAGSVPGLPRTRYLASLPVALIPGPAPVFLDEGPSPVRLSLIVAWTGVLLAGLAVGILLLGVVTLSERRATFVSAVTHEMRTPLTTFQMYTEMLAEGMVRDPEKRGRYLETLRAEASRLGHLVENVLAYARLERGRAGSRVETVAIRDLVRRVEERLARRAAQANMEFGVEANDASLAARVKADASAVEQILLNLVDNACKYARSAADRRLRLEVVGGDGRAALRVRDQGPGVSPHDARRLFRPFGKSAGDAAHTAPGVGLGLALSRRLARKMGGDLRLAPCEGNGACFELSLLVARD